MLNEHIKPAQFHWAGFSFHCTLNPKVLRKGSSGREVGRKMQQSLYSRPMAAQKLTNPDWNRDELILALDAYLQWKGMPPAKTSPEIQALSHSIGAIQGTLGTEKNPTFRNTNGVYMKLMNFRRFDPAFTSLGKAGLSRGNHLEEEVWQTFSSQPERLAHVAVTIRNIVNSGEIADSTMRLEDGMVEAIEGRIVTVLHYRRERAKHLVDRKKAQAIASDGTLSCEVCGFNFAMRYGGRGEGFIECHHTKAVETLGDGKPTRLSDLALVCANCHRMIHSKRPWLTLLELKGILQSV